MASTALICVPDWLRAATLLSPAGATSRRLAFVHTHTAEELSIVYWQDGHYVPEALASLNRLLRDWRTSEVADMDPRLLDLLWELAQVTGTQSPYHIICGYRSAETNAMLRERSSGVAKSSQHILGRAIDVRLADVGSAALRDAAIGLARGGVGYYATTDFVHLDVARVRTW